MVDHFSQGLKFAIKFNRRTRKLKALDGKAPKVCFRTKAVELYLVEKNWFP